MGFIHSAVPDEGATTTTKEFDDTRPLRFCEVFLIGGWAIPKRLRAAVYNTTGLNYQDNPRDSCPDVLVKGLDLDAAKKDNKVLATYLNKPRFWIFDHLKVPVGPVREFNGLKGYWMGVGSIPKDANPKEPGWLTYRRQPIERLTEITFREGKPVFILDDPEGKPWVMKSYRDDYGQTYESLSTLGARYNRLPAGWTFRVAELDRDLHLAPTKAGGKATVMQDEFENTFDYLGDGSSNFVP